MSDSNGTRRIFQQIPMDSIGFQRIPMDFTGKNMKKSENVGKSRKFMIRLFMIRLWLFPRNDGFQSIGPSRVFQALRKQPQFGCVNVRPCGQVRLYIFKRVSQPLVLQTTHSPLRFIDIYSRYVVVGHYREEEGQSVLLRCPGESCFRWSSAETCATIHEMLPEPRWTDRG